MPYYAAIDLKAFYSSVECHELGLDPLTTNLVVADEKRTDKTICLAITPSLKSYGLPGRARLFEVKERVRAINYERQKLAPGQKFCGKSSNMAVLQKHPEYALDFIIAPPRMQRYLNYSNQIYQTYLDFIAPEDIFAYSIDEIFCDLSSYLKYSKLTPEELVTKMIRAVYEATGITATAGIGTNLYLAKVAMDIIAKHAEPNPFGARIAFLNERTYKEKLWNHQPLQDFWRIGPGIARKLHAHQMRTMGDVALCSLSREDLLFKLFGINAELLIDHAWGIEPTTIHDIKTYQSSTKSINNGQVLSEPYNYAKARIIIKEMSNELAIELTTKNYKTNQLVLHIIYDVKNPDASKNRADRYGRKMPAPAHGTLRLKSASNALAEIRNGFLMLFDQIINQEFLIRKINLCAGNLQPCNQCSAPEQLELFQQQSASQKTHSNELEKAIIDIRDRFGANAILTGANFEPGATGQARHQQIGGHQA